MNANNSHAAAQHAALQEMLPWYANGSLLEADAQRLQAHLRECAACREDLAWQRRLLETEGPLPTGIDAEGALARLLPRLEMPIAAARQGAIAMRLRRWLQAQGRWQFAAMAAQLVLITALTVQLLQRETVPAYHVLGRGQASTPDLLIMFRPEARLQDVQRLLQGGGARIVGGPTVAGAYLVEVEAARRDRLLAVLRADPAVELAEALVPGSRP